MNSMVKTLSNILKKHQMQILRITGALIGVAFVVLLMRYQLKLTNYIEWQDESETIIVTKMMAQGARLYVDVYNNHGPLTFLLGYIISLIGHFSLYVYRYPIILLQNIALLSIYFSPVQGASHLKRLASVSVTVLFWILFFPYIYGHTYLYQTQSGLIFIIVLAQYVLPLVLDKELNRLQKFMGPFLIACLPFFAVTNLPMVLIIIMITVRKKEGWLTWAGYILGLLFNLFFLIAVGSMDGYFAYHFYLNSVMLNQGKGIIGYLLNILNYYQLNFTNFLTLGWMFVIVQQLVKLSKGISILKSLMFAPMLVSLVIRGGAAYDLFGLVYLYVLSGLTMVLFIEPEQVDNRALRMAPALLSILTCLFFLLQPKPMDELFWKIPTESQFSLIAKRVTQPNEKIQALSFRSFEYLLSDRMPSSAHFIYLPIQAAYNQKPFKNIKSDLLQDLKNNKPKLILMDRWSPDVPWDEYAKDIVSFVEENYLEIGTTDIYYRKDLNLYEYNVDPKTGDILN